MKKAGLILFIAILFIVCGISLFFIDQYLNGVRSENKIQTVAERIEAAKEEYNQFTDRLIDVSVANNDTLKVVDTNNFVNVLEIPTINVRAYIYDNIDKDSLDYGVGRYPETKKVGELGNCAIAGHASDIYKCIFNNLQDVGLYDKLYAYDAVGLKHTYYVTDKYITSPADMSVLDTTDNKVSKLTLITCTESGKKRFIVEACEYTEDELTEYKDYWKTMKNEAILSQVSILFQDDLYSFMKQRYNTSNPLHFSNDKLRDCYDKWIVDFDKLKLTNNGGFNYDIA